MRQPPHKPEVKNLLEDRWRRTEATYRERLAALGLSPDQFKALLAMGSRLYWRGAVDIVTMSAGESRSSN